MDTLDLPAVGAASAAINTRAPDLAAASGRVAAATAAMEAAGGPVALAELARVATCSPRQLQRDFASVLGVTPRDYGASRRTARARIALQSTNSVSTAIYDAGYGSVRAFYEEAAARLGMSPREYAARAPGRLLLWSACDSALGGLLAVASPDGLCAVRLGPVPGSAEEVRREFAGAQLQRDDDAMRDVMAALRQLAAGFDAPCLPVAAAGTAFQARVWAALRRIPLGETRSYREVAAQIGRPDAVRAVAGACAANPVALAIPCHRVVRSDGQPAGYRWGLAVKIALLASERPSATQSEG